MILVAVKNLASKIFMQAGDTLNVLFRGETIISHPASKDSVIDKIEIYELENEAGYKDGYAVYIGESE